MTTAVLITVSLWMGFSSPSHAASQPCRADAAIQNFQNSARGLVTGSPALMREVDNCFNNSERPEYSVEAKKILQTMNREYQVALNKLNTAYDALKAGRDAEYKQGVNQVVNKLTQVSQPLFKNASNLKKHGFTTSDRQVDGRLLYPNCNSQKNNQPEKKWSSFYANAQAAQKALQQLAASANCLN